MGAVLDGELRASELPPQDPVSTGDRAREEEVVPPSTARRVEALPKSEAVLLQKIEQVRQVVLLDAEAATEAGAVVQTIQVEGRHHAHHGIPGPAWRWWFH